MKNSFPFLILLIIGCSTPPKSIHQVQQKQERIDKPVNLAKIKVGLDVLLDDRPELITNKKVGLVTNQSGIDRNGVPNYERFLGLDDVNLKIIFSPEHGLFGEASAGEKVEYNGQLKRLPEVVSLYGKNRKPTQAQLKGLDLIIYDIQDIGARFYTYISTLGLVMEAAADAGIEVMVLDRPNPIAGKKIEGPLLAQKHKSFVGFYPIPIRYGMTVGELAQMIIGENWIDINPDLTVIPVRNWNRSIWMDETNLPWVKPSPNIPDLATAIVYPGMCLLEATNLNEGRGTQKPFKQVGSPWVQKRDLAIALNNLNLPGVVFKPVSYTPIDIPGMAIDPKHKEQLCEGVELMVTNRNKYNSALVGVHVINAIHQLYPNQLTINESAMARLWGQDGFSEDLNKGKIFSHLTNNDFFKNQSQKYYIYD